MQVGNMADHNYLDYILRALGQVTVLHKLSLKMFCSQPRQYGIPNSIKYESELLTELSLVFGKIRTESFNYKLYLHRIL